ncbi:response regulator transcription factor [Maribrevibacterium harenarium]|uniref:Response regulator transcription factor n=1 Tax=Maribrevibacterium harenarium TaxID=2589817 RepID=A0A501WF49_9GAMM|nr:winged helix-turn-helix domain-containing protein [Maribrevibacterium harenarium]TPE46980.1 response regulator transcription factor [Maribrevibacterium harenarium]
MQLQGIKVEFPSMLNTRTVHFYYDSPMPDLVSQLNAKQAVVTMVPIKEVKIDRLTSLVGVQAVILKTSERTQLLEWIRQVRMRSDALVFVFVNDPLEAELALRCGADGFVDKSTDYGLFSLALLNAIQRFFGLPRQMTFDFFSEVPVPEVVLDSQRQVLSVSGKSENLTRAEFILMKRLLQSEGEVVTRDVLLDCLAEEANVSSPGTLDTLIYRLRKKVAKHTHNHQFIVTVPTVGFRLEPMR